MTDFDARLKNAAERCQRKQKITSALDELYAQQRELSDKVIKLKVRMKSEQTDVDRLEGRSLYAFFYYVIGKKDEMLTKEREEAYAARVKYDSAAAELKAVEIDIESYNNELQDLGNCENEYAAALKEKAAAIKNSGLHDADRLIKIEEEINAVAGVMREVREAISAGQRAKGIADSILARLTKAESWSTYDMIAGDGIISHMIKHDHMDAAQGEIENLQIALRKFKTELTDVKIDASMHVNISGFLRFADYFFDNIFVDLEVRNRIKDSKQQVSDTKRRITDVLNKLSQMLDDAEREKAKLEDEYSSLISAAKI